jgi:hypothetical protein
VGYPRSRPMGMRKTTIRLSDRLWELIQAEAEREGLTGAQYMREAIIARVFYEQGMRGAAFGGAAEAAPEPPAEPDASDRSVRS